MNALLMEKLSKKVQHALKLSGFNVRREYCYLIVKKFQESNKNLESDFEENVKSICSSLETQSLAGHSIEKANIETTIEMCLKSGYDRNETVFNVINAFDFPKLCYNTTRKIYSKDVESSKLLPVADAKIKLFFERYSSILQRTKRSFSHSLLGAEKNHLKLQTVDYLLTLSEAKLDHTLILGSLLQVAENKYFLEDPTGIVQLDLSHANYHTGFFVENVFVLVNGYYEDRILCVSTIALPPGEEYQDSRPSFGNINYFGGNSDVPLRDSKTLKRHLLENKNAMFMFFSDVWLDNNLIFDKLEKLFMKTEQFAQPIAFVFMGNFMAESQGNESLDVLKKLFKKFAELISKFPNIVALSQFVFIPGLLDPCTPHIVPRLELPTYVTEDMQKILPNAIFATNPCRIQYCTKEIVIFRADLVPKFMQGTLNKPRKQEIGNNLAKTLISQGHLSPMALNALTVHWDFDYCLSVYPLPDLIVVGDRSESYQGIYKNCIVVNPGQFCADEFPFKMYYPNNDLQNAIEDCVVDVDDVAESSDM
ncbi:DNA polymerase epsilon subunit 2 [Cylas formicarius]|uniref:DNA polymerase epsilon subunit 2 n=1 Tax=Cylas formicarius TaxID=197179 RepID=UPI002958820E|nr:DNA polymerase epsilon subunit 2 [Cylas formicarius]